MRQPHLPLFQPTTFVARAENWASQHPELVARGGGVLGCSGLTQGKHIQMGEQVAMVARACHPEIRRGREYVHIETHGGDGLYEHAEMLMIGSPPLALEEYDNLPIFAEEGYRYSAFFCERRPPAAARLRSNLAGLEVGRYANRVEVIDQTCQIAIPVIADKLRLGTRGLLFVDPNGLLPQALAGWSRIPNLHNIDFMFWVDLHVGQRFRGLRPDVGGKVWRVDSPRFQGDTRPLGDILDGIAKTRWVIRRPFRARGRERTIIIGSNWKYFPVWRREGYCLVEEPEGQAILARAA